MSSKDLHIETERLLIRPYSVEDAPALKQAIDESLPELLPFMPWAKDEPQLVDAKVLLINEWNKEIQKDTDYTLGIFDKETGKFIGSTGLHLRSVKQAVEIGYWCATKHTGKGLITESTKALANFAFIKLNAERIEIHCDDNNVKSAAIPKRIGFNHEFTYRMLAKDADGNRKKHQVWYLFKEEWKG